MEEREKRGENRIQILRLEQLYPFPENVLAEELNALPQGGNRLVPGRAEEPGRLDLRRAAHRRDTSPTGRQAAALRYIGRPEYASTAAGLMKPAQRRTAAFLNDALNLESRSKRPL